MDDSRFEPLTPAFISSVSSHAYVSYKTPTILQTMLRIMWAKSKKKKRNPTTELNICVSIFFRRKVKEQKVQQVVS